MQVKYKIEFGFGVGEDRDGNAISIERRNTALAEIKRVAVEFFGGYTIVTTDGGWKNARGMLVEEQGRTLFVLIDESKGERHFFRADAMAEIIKGQLNQESVVVTKTAVEFTFV